MDGLLEVGRTFLQNQPWSPEGVLTLGAHLAQRVNQLESLSGPEKSDLVCRTILQLLDEAEKADAEQKPGSTDSDCSKPVWEEVRKIVQTVLPVTLTLLVDAARGKFDLGKVVLVAESIPWMSCFSCLRVLLPVKIPEQPLAPPIRPPPVVVEPPKELESREAAEAVPESEIPPSTVEAHETSEENRP